MLLTLNNIAKLITFAKENKIPHVKIKNFECSIPIDESNEIAKLKADIQDLKGAVNKLILAADIKSNIKQQNPFSTRAQKNG